MRVPARGRTLKPGMPPAASVWIGPALMQFTRMFFAAWGRRPDTNFTGAHDSRVKHVPCTFKTHQHRGVHRGAHQMHTRTARAQIQIQTQGPPLHITSHHINPEIAPHAYASANLHTNTNSNSHGHAELQLSTRAWRARGTHELDGERAAHGLERRLCKPHNAVRRDHLRRGQPRHARTDHPIAQAPIQ